MRNNKGFTLIELLLVAAILSVLVVVALVIIDPVAQFQKANDARRKSDLSQIQKALEAYYEDHGFYPCNSSTTFQIVDADDRADETCVASGLAFDGSSSWQPYMKILPADPNSKKRYRYYSPDGQTYYVYASLDRAVKDASACNPGSGDVCTSIGAQDITCGTGSVGAYTNSSVCNYGVSSPNKTP